MASNYKNTKNAWVHVDFSYTKGVFLLFLSKLMFMCFFAGYGHIAPSTKTGRAITIVYAIIGIPLFLILLADFGKLFTRCIKYVWAFVRRLYYTGSCRKVRRTVPVQVMIYWFCKWIILKIKMMSNINILHL